MAQFLSYGLNLLNLSLSQYGAILRKIAII
jgi:hypothetical protein